MRHFVAAFAAASATFLALDAIWLSAMGSLLYRPALGHIMREDFDVIAAALFYAIYLVGVVVLVVRPARDGQTAFLRGALFGLVCYATYDLTNQATVVSWPWRVTLVDLCWGTCVTAISAWTGYRTGQAAMR